MTVDECLAVFRLKSLISHYLLVISYRQYNEVLPDIFMLYDFNNLLH